LRKSLFLAAALAPLCGAPALAASVDSARTTPIATSTADTGPGDVTITTNGSITVTGVTPAVTLDSSNAVSNAGTIQTQNVDNSTGVLIQGGNTGSFNNTGTISLIEDYSAPDANSDGVLEGPYATGNNRVGVRLTGTAPFVGDIVNGGAITIEGRNSAAISLEGPLRGSLVSSGAITMTGDGSAGIRVAAPVSGVVRVQGAINAQGIGVSGIDTSADVAGSLSVYSTISNTGYGLTTRPTFEDSLKKIQATPSEVEQSGSAIHIGGSLGQGFYVGAPLPDTTSDTTADNDGDGLPDNSVGSGAITNYGSAPAVLIGSSSRDILLGQFGTGANAYGVIIKGAVTGAGVYDGFSATGMQIGGLGGRVDISGGIKVFGAVSATTFDASATGLRLGAGASTPELRIENGVSAVIQHSTVATTTASAQAVGLALDAGASLPTLTNIGTITAQATGDGVTASAVVDKSGSITNITNQGAIIASVTPVTSGLSVAGKTVALDLRANTAGVTLIQSINPSPIVLSKTTTASTVTTITSPTAPSIVGDILLGSGPNNVQLLGGYIAGALDLGSGPSSLLVGNGATYVGDLRHTGSALSINVEGGNLNDTHIGVLQATSLTVGPTGVLTIAVDPQKGLAGGFQVLGPATFADGAKLGVTLSSILTQPQAYTLISANSLTVGASGLGTLGSTPYAINASINTNVAAGTVTLNIRRKTGAEIGFNATEGAAFDGIYGALGADSLIQNAVLGETTKEGFLANYRQLLPDYSGGIFRLVRAATEATSRSAAQADSSPGSLWVQETAYGVDSSDKDAQAYRGAGFGFVAGLDGAEGSLGRLGATLSFLAGQTSDPDTIGDDLQSFTEFEGSLYWRMQAGGLRLDARGSGGLVTYKNRREFLVKDANGAITVDRTANGSSKGFAVSGRFGASYQIGGPRFFVRPQVHLDYFRLKQNGYAETGGGDGFDLTLGDRTGSSTTVTTSVVIGAGLGETARLQPSLELGYRHGLSGNPGITTAEFKNGTDFKVFAPPIKGENAAVGRLNLKSSSDFFDLSLSAGAETRSEYLEGDLQFRARLAF
jgi:outer membrane autotransporter protein